MDKFKIRFKDCYKYLILILLGMYIAPNFTTDYKSSYILIYGIVITFIILVLSYINGLVKSFNPLLPIMVAIMFIPVVFIYLNSSALYFCVVYMIVSFVGNGTGVFTAKLFTKFKFKLD
ncbi:MAG: hypothetical protein RR435_06420 [Erysipelotrichaceae bacterium]